MRLLYYCPEYYCHHGGRTHARGFFTALGNISSVTESYLYPKEEGKDQASTSQGKPLHRGKLRFLPKTVRKVVQQFLPRPKLTEILIKEIKEHRCDALVIRTGSYNPIIGRIKKACPDTVICLEVNSAAFDESFHGLPFRPLFQKLEAIKFSAADAIIVVSSYLKNYLEKRGIPSRKILVNQNGVSADVVNYTGNEDIRQQYGISSEDFLLGYVGGMEPFRRLPEVVRHIAELRKAGHSDIYLLMIGDGEDMPAVREAIEDHHNILDGAIICLGWLPHSEVAKYLAAFDVAIFPFTNDYCSPLKLFEYLGAGVPAIGPDTSAVREVFKDGVHLKLVKQDGSNLKSLIFELRDNPAMRKELGVNGRRLVINEYTWEKNAERLLAHIQGVHAQ